MSPTQINKVQRNTRLFYQNMIPQRLSFCTKLAKKNIPMVKNIRLNKFSLITAIKTTQAREIQGMSCPNRDRSKLIFYAKLAEMHC